jgi:hypothetical protein
MSPMSYKVFVSLSDGSKALVNRPTYANKVTIGKLDFASVGIGNLPPSETRKLLSMAVYCYAKDGEGLCKQVADNSEIVLTALAHFKDDKLVSVYHPTYDESNHTMSETPVLTYTMTVKDLMAKLTGKEYIKPIPHNHAVKVEKSKVEKTPKGKKYLTLDDAIKAMEE